MIYSVFFLNFFFLKYEKYELRHWFKVLQGCTMVKDYYSLAAQEKRRFKTNGFFYLLYIILYHTRSNKL